MSPRARRSVLWALPLGALGGAAWGVVFRVWMRYVSDDPEFTWSGTLYIVAAPTVLGVFVAAVRVAHATTWLRRLLRSLLGVLTLSLGVAAGAVFLPTLVLGTAAVAPRRAPRATRALLLVAAAAVPVALFGTAFPDDEGLGAVGFAVAVAWYAAICAAAVVGHALAWRTPGASGGVGAGAADHAAG